MPGTNQDHPSLATIFSRRVHPTRNQRHAGLSVGDEKQGKVVKAMAILSREGVILVGATLPNTAPFVG
jgi:hypothetical protein